MGDEREASEAHGTPLRLIHENIKCVGSRTYGKARRAFGPSRRDPGTRGRSRTKQRKTVQGPSNVQSAGRAVHLPGPPPTPPARPTPPPPVRRPRSRPESLSSTAPLAWAPSILPEMCSAATSSSNSEALRSLCVSTTNLRISMTWSSRHLHFSASSAVLNGLIVAPLPSGGVHRKGAVSASGPRSTAVGGGTV